MARKGFEMIVRTDRGHTLKVTERGITDRGECAGRCRYAIPGQRFIKSRQRFSQTRLLNYCERFEVLEDEEA